LIDHRDVAGLVPAKGVGKHEHHSPPHSRHCLGA
jgi:hypothetical protein